MLSTAPSMKEVVEHTALSLKLTSTLETTKKLRVEVVSSLLLSRMIYVGYCSHRRFYSNAKVVDREAIWDLSLELVIQIDGVL